MLNVETKRPIIPISITLMALLNILKELESDISPLYALFYLIITTNTASSIYYVWPPGCKEPNQDGNCICQNFGHHLVVLSISIYSLTYVLDLNSSKVA